MPGCAGGARELRFPQCKKAQFVAVKSIESAIPGPQFFSRIVKTKLRLHQAGISASFQVLKVKKGIVILSLFE